jgi:HAD superfamily hydrolase (TIGR01509 family)
MNLKGIIFDCDGLLVDTETPDFASWQSIFASYGATLSFDFWQKGIGSRSILDAYQMLESQLGKPVDKESIRAARRQQYKQLVMEQGLLPGVLETIQLAQQMKMKLAVASSSSFQWVSWCLEQFQLKAYFEIIVTADDVSITKPNPEIYLKALEHMNCHASEVPNRMTHVLDFSHASLVLESLEKLNLKKLL